MLEDLFRSGAPDPLSRAADHCAGALAVLTGIAANRSFATGLPIAVDDLFKL